MLRAYALIIWGQRMKFPRINRQTRIGITVKMQGRYDEVKTKEFA
jgi:hypothetical protein